MARRIFFTLGVQGADDAIDKVVALDKELKDLTETMRKARAAGNDALYDNAAKSAVKYKQALSEARKELRASVAENKAAQYSTTSLIALENQYAKLREEIRLFSQEERESASGKNKINLAANLSTQIRDIDKQMGAFKSSIGNYKDGLAQVADTLSGGLLGNLRLGGSAAVAAGGLAIAAGTAQLFQLNAKFSDLKADIAKTTNLSAKETTQVLENLKDIDTRTSLENLAKIAAIGGQLGVKGVAGVTAFTKSLEVLDVALGNEFKGGTEEVATEIGKLSTVLFGVTDDGEVLAQRMLGIGNALNYLAASGNATSPVITDFAQRMGGVLAPLDVTAGQILGLSAAMEELAISPERGATAAARSIMRMGANIEQFSRVLGVSQKSLSDAFNTNPLDAFLKVIELVNQKAGGDKTSMLAILNDLGIRGAGVSEVFFKFGQNMQLVADRVGDATTKLGEQGSVMAEYAIKQENLAGSWERLKNSMSEFFVNSGIEKFFTTLVGGAASAVKSLGDTISLKGFSDIQKAKDAEKAKVEASKPEIQKLFEAKQANDLFGIESKLNKFSEDRINRRREELKLQGLTTEQIEKQLLLESRSFAVQKDSSKTQAEKNKAAEAAIGKLESGGLDGKYVSEEEKKRLAIIKKEKKDGIKEQKDADRDRLETLKNIEDAEARIAKLKADSLSNPFDREEANLQAASAKARADAAIPRLGVTADMVTDEQKLIDAALLRDLDELNKKRLYAHRQYQEELEDLQSENNIRLLEINQTTFEQHYEDLKLSRDLELDAAETAYNKEQDALDSNRAKGLLTENKYDDLSLKAREDYAQKVVDIDAKHKKELADAAEKQYNAQKELLEKQSREEISRIRRKAEADRRVIDNRTDLTFFQKGEAITKIDSSEQSQIDAKELEHLNKIKDLEAQIAAIRLAAEKDSLDAANKREKSTDDTAEKERVKRERLNQELKEGAIELGRQISEALFDDRKRQIEEEKEFELQAIKTRLDEELELASGNNTLQKALKKQYEVEKREIEKNAFEQNKKIKIQEAIANASLAVINAFATIPLPFAYIAAALVATKTAFEIANIKKTKFFAKGGFTGFGGGLAPDETGHVPVGVVHENEYVAPTHQIKKYPSLFKFLDSDRSRKFADGGLTSAFSGGGSSSSLKVELSGEQIKLLSDSVYEAAKSGTTSGAKEGVYLGSSDAVRLKERTESLASNSSF
jgi:TP901 family phage tail tape measure protein